MMHRTYRLRRLPTADLNSHTPFPRYTRANRPVRWWKAMNYPVAS